MSSLQTAIGIKHPRILQRAQGFMGGSFDTRECFHGRSGEWLRGVKWSLLMRVFALPLPCLGAGVATGSIAWLTLAFVLQYLGLLAGRWIFLAPARHPQHLYARPFPEPFDCQPQMQDSTQQPSHAALGMGVIPGLMPIERAPQLRR
jgi:hypothetical protein